MKKTIIAALVMLQLAWLAGPALAEFTPTQAKLTFIRGTVQIQRTGFLTWTPAALKMKVYAGDRISCEDQSEAEIALDDGSVLKLKDKTLFEIERMDKQKKPLTTVTALRAVSGKVLGCVRKLSSKESRFTISTPTAVAGIRGTVFGVFVEGDTTELDVLKGEVAIAGDQGAEVLVGEKMMTTVAKGGAAAAPVALTAAKLAFLAAWAGAAIKLGLLGTAATTAWYATTPAIIAGAAAVAVTTVVTVVVAQKKDNPTPPTPPAPPAGPKIPGPPNWPGTKH